MSARDVKDSMPVLGASPRVSLLPPEVKQRAKAAKTRRNAVALVFLALIISALGIAGAVLYSASQSATLQAAQARTATLLESQQEFAEVRAVVAALGNAEQARILAGSTDVDWRSWHISAMSTLPEGGRLVSVVVDSVTPAEVFPAPTVPLQGDRVASITYQIETRTLPDLQAWLDTLAGLPGFVDYQLTSTVFTAETSNYLSTVVIHVDAAAYSLRFAGEEDTQ